MNLKSLLEHNPAYIEKKGEKLAKQNRKDADEMNKNTSKKYRKAS